MYIGNPVYQVAFLTDTFSGNNSTTVFTMSVAPANTASVLVAVSGVLQDPSTYSVVGTTLTFTQAPPTGTGNISARYLGIPASNVTTTAYRTITEFTATASQTTFTPPSYTVGFINVYRNGVRLGSADYTATNGTTVVLASGAASGDLVAIESFLVSSVLNAIPNTAGSVGSSNLANNIALVGATNTGQWTAANMPTGSVIQTVSYTLENAQSFTSGSSTQTAQATNVTANITPQFSSSRIKVSVYIPLQYYITSVANPSYGYFFIYRGGSNITSPNGFGAFGNQTTTGYWYYNSAFAYLDSPASTSSLTYTIYLAFGNNTGQVTLSVSPGFMYNSGSTILLEEIR